MEKDRQAEAEVEVGEEDEPLEWIERLVGRIGGQRLAAGDERIPERELSGGDHIVQNVADRVVLQGEVPDVEVAAEKDDVAEDCSEDREEKGDGREGGFPGAERAQF